MDIYIMTINPADYFKEWYKELASLFRVRYVLFFFYADAYGYFIKLG